MTARVFTGNRDDLDRLKKFEVKLVFTRSMVCTLKATSAKAARDIAEELHYRVGNRAFISDDEGLVRIVVIPEEGRR